MVAAALRGFAFGLGWGMLARVFMRLLSTSPEFSWAGTLMILGLSAVLWAGIAVVADAPRLGLVLFLGAGMVLLPGALGVALWRALRSKVLGAACMGAGLVVTVYGVVGDRPFTDAAGAPVAAWFGVGLLVVATVLLGLGLHTWARRWTPPAPARIRSGPRSDPAAYADGETRA